MSIEVPPNPHRIKTDLLQVGSEVVAGDDPRNVEMFGKNAECLICGAASSKVLVNGHAEMVGSLLLQRIVEPRRANGDVLAHDITNGEIQNHDAGGDDRWTFARHQFGQGLVIEASFPVAVCEHADVEHRHREPFIRNSLSQRGPIHPVFARARHRHHPPVSCGATVALRLRHRLAD